jgi:hypothetical protein
VSLLWDKDKFWIRDIHLFDETYPERYLKDVCTTADCTYDALPVFDGGSWDSEETAARMQAVEIGSEGNSAALSGLEPEVKEEGDTRLVVRWPLKEGGALEIVLTETGIEMESGKEDWGLEMAWGQDETQIREVKEKKISYEQMGHKYEAALASGMFEQGGEKRIIVRPEKGKIVLRLEVGK